jgi:hypothetical protein
METLQIPNAVKEMLLYTEGKSIQDKLVRLIMSDLENRFRSCTERLYEFEKKYRLAFRPFKEAWETDASSEKYSYEIEKDYMEWESLDDEHDFLLSQMRAVKKGLSS